MTRVRDRAHAGRLLGERLRAYADRPDVIVLGLPRGGVPVAFEVAKRLRVPLDVFVVRKLGVPGHEELAMGAIASGGVRMLNEDVVAMARVSERDVETVTLREEHELARRERAYRGDRSSPDVAGRTVILVDDGLATGATIRAAAAAIRVQQPSEIVAAAPVGASQACGELDSTIDHVICATDLHAGEHVYFSGGFVCAYRFGFDASNVH